MGILFAVVALLAWGFGDFLIQKSAREFGDWIALFFITAFGTVVLFPFVYGTIGAAWHAHGGLLLVTTVILLLASILNFEALRRGKISVIEPIFAFEVPVSALLAGWVAHENLAWPQVLLIGILLVGIFLISSRSFTHWRSIHTERGVWLAVFGTLAMGASSFLFGFVGRESSPLLVNWFTSAALTIIVLLYLAQQGKLTQIGRRFRADARLALNLGFLDNLAWVMFTYSMLYIPIGIATGISEGYVAFAGMLGLLFNHEKLRKHQKAGFVLAAISVVVLAIITDR